jgi:hypothetical protein
MHDAFRTVGALRSGLSTRRDLLLEHLALRHQLGVLARSHRRFRPSDRLLRLCLRRLWPRWRDALVLVQPATVARWRRQGFRGCWSRHSRRRPGRPRIDSQVRALIRRMATENRLWGAPRIHGELLKLGVTVAERTVSRYLPDRPTAPSQTWRTFLANHLGDLAFTSTVTSSSAPGDDDVVDEDARVFPWCPAPPSRAQPCVSNPCAVVDWPSSLERTSLGCRVAQDHLHRRARTRSSSGKDCGSKPTNSLRPLAGSWIASAVLGVSRCNRSSTSSEGTDVDFVPPAKRTSATDFHSARNIGEAHPVVISS